MFELKNKDFYSVSGGLLLTRATRHAMGFLLKSKDKLVEKAKKMAGHATKTSVGTAAAILTERCIQRDRVVNKQS